MVPVEFAGEILSRSGDTRQVLARQHLGMAAALLPIDIGERVPHPTGKGRERHQSLEIGFIGRLAEAETAVKTRIRPAKAHRPVETRPGQAPPHRAEMRASEFRREVGPRPQVPRQEVDGAETGARLVIAHATPHLEGKAGEYFGLYGLTTKISVIGNFVFSIVADLAGFRPALLVLVFPAVTGCGFLIWSALLQKK